jgi:group I intron endonuclease
MFGYIYKTTNLINGKSYIGKRKGEFDKSYYGSGMILQKALKKYGKENFEVVILSKYDNEDDLNSAEIMFIESFNPTYNIAKGGTGGDTLARADEQYKQEVIAKRKQGMSNAWSNTSEEQRKQWGENISKAKKGKATRPSDYTHSEEVKQRIKESNLNAVKPDSWRENILKAAENRRGKSLEKRQTPVEINGKTYPGVIAASNALNVSRQCINRWIKKGKAKYV